MDPYDDSGASVYRSLPLGAAPTAASGGRASLGLPDLAVFASPYTEKPVYRSLSVLQPIPAASFVGCGAAKPASFVGAVHSTVPEKPARVLKSIPAPPPPAAEEGGVSLPYLPIMLNDYPISATHAFASVGARSLLTRLTAELKASNVDFVFKEAKFKFKCQAFTSEHAPLSFVINLWALSEEESRHHSVLVEATLRSGCVMQWHSLFERIFSEMLDVVQLDRRFSEAARHRRRANAAFAKLKRDVMESGCGSELRESQIATSELLLNEREKCFPLSVEARHCEAQQLASLTAEPHVAKSLEMGRFAPLLKAECLDSESRLLALSSLANVAQATQKKPSPAATAGAAGASVSDADLASTEEVLRHVCRALQQGSGGAWEPFLASFPWPALCSLEVQREAARACAGAGFAMCLASLEDGACESIVRDLSAELQRCAASDDPRLSTISSDALRNLEACCVVA